MPGLVSFADFIMATRETPLITREAAMNEATQRNYFLRHMLKGRGNNDVFRGGKKLIEHVMTSDNGSFRFYQPGEEHNPTGKDTLKRIEVDWRFAMSDYVFTDEETELNEGDETAFLDLKRNYEQAAITSNFNGMEAALFATPDPILMETAGADGKIAFSLPAFITENANFLPGAAWSTLMTIDPASNAWWRNQRVGYNSAKLFSTNPADNDSLLAAMDDMWLSIKFDKLPSTKTYSESDDLQKMKILTNKDGHKTMSRLLRSMNNRLVPDKNDPAYPDPMFNGYPIEFVESLDNARLYDDAPLAASHTNGVAKAGYPRFYFPNMRYLYTVFHSKRYLYPIVKDGGANQPTAHVVFYNTWYNLVCRSRRRQGIVYPSV